MRGAVIRCVLAATSLGAVATGATALSTLAPTPYDQTLTLAGGEPAVDPDAPIATARYGDAPRRPAMSAAVSATTVDLAGATTPLAGGPVSVPAENLPAPKPVQMAEASSPPPIQTLATPRKRAGSAVVTVSDTPAPTLGLVRAPPRRIPLTKVEDIEIQPFNMPSEQSAVRRLSVNASALMGRMSGSAQDPRRGRWVLFAASSGKAVSMNVIRTSLDGWRGSGWSQERLARFGTHQLGVGWRKDGKQLSLSATRRKFRAQDYSDRDVVYGVTLSIKGR